MKTIALSIALLCINITGAQAAEPQTTEELQAAAPSTFERAARQAAAKQGWPGYPDSYQDAFVAGARWANNRKKALTCSEVFPSDLSSDHSSGQ